MLYNRNQNVKRGFNLFFRLIRILQFLITNFVIVCPFHRKSIIKSSKKVEL